MRIVIITQNYLPEMGALSNRIYPMARELGKAGHLVTVATGMPNYPAGRAFDGYKGHVAMKERLEGADVIRTAFYTVPRNISKARQMLSYLSFIPASLVSALRAGPADVVVVTTPPIFPILTAIFVAKLRGAKLVLDVRDLWSDELVNFAGLGERSFAVRLFRMIERWGYKSADLVCCTTQSLADTVISRGGHGKSTLVYPNGADLDVFKLSENGREAVPVLERLGDRFVFMYSGLFGLKHGLEAFIDAAAILKDQKDIVFALAGNGAAGDDLMKRVKNHGIDNVVFLGELPLEQIPTALSRSDVCYAGERGDEYQEKVISVKIFEYMACERPVVGALVGESARIVSESKSGVVVRPGDAQGIADSVLRLKNDPARRRAMGKAGRAYVAANYSRGEWARRFEGWLTRLVEERDSSTSLEAAEIPS